jgi:hypothetical protein
LNVIKEKGMNKSVIIKDECVDCGVCIRAGVCPVDAIYFPETPWPRSIRAMFSGGAHSFGPDYEYVKTKATTHALTYDDIVKGQIGRGSRGTQEMKTNDVLGRFKDEDVGLALEFGRPGVGFRFHDIEKASMALSKHGAEFEPQNPYSVLINLDTGEIKKEYKDLLNEKAMSAIIECKAPKEKLPELFEVCMDVAKKIDCVYTMNIISKCKDGEIILKPLLEEAGIKVRINGKTNVGLGRPYIP